MADKKELLSQTIEHIDIKKHSPVPLVEAMQHMAYSARDLARAADIYDRMLRENECGVILCLAGGVLAPLTGLLPSSGGAYIAKAFITVITGGAAVISGTLSSAVILGTVNQLVSFAAHPVIGEIAMLVLAIILLRLMPTGITGRFFRDGT